MKLPAAFDKWTPESIFHNRKIIVAHVNIYVNSSFSPTSFSTLVLIIAELQKIFNLSSALVQYSGDCLPIKQRQFMMGS